jgi:hypothetical protein
MQAPFLFIARWLVVAVAVGLWIVIVPIFDLVASRSSSRRDDALLWNRVELDRKFREAA